MLFFRVCAGRKLNCELDCEDLNSVMSKQCHIPASIALFFRTLDSNLFILKQNTFFSPVDLALKTQNNKEKGGLTLVKAEAGR